MKYIKSILVIALLALSVSCEKDMSVTPSRIYTIDATDIIYPTEQAKINAIVADRTYDLQLQLRSLNSEYNRIATQYNNRMQQYQNEFQLQLQEYQVYQNDRQLQMKEL